MSATWYNTSLRLINARDPDLTRVTTEALNALIAANDPPTLFRFAGRIVRLEMGDTAQPILRDLTAERLVERLARIVFWYKEDAEGNRWRVRPPRAVAVNILATPNLPLPILDRVVTVPVFALDGTLHRDEGYNSATRTIFVPLPGFVLVDVSLVPPGEEIEYAVELILLELLGDFPFVGDAERAHALCALLLPFVRDLIAGPTPLHLIEKPARGTGGTLLAHALCSPALGRSLSGISPAKEESEWRRTLFSRLRDVPSVLLIDNIHARLESAALASMITAQHYSDRVVGTSDMLDVPIRCLWLATANNALLSDEIARRTIRIRLDAKMERPELRTGFRHPDLMAWAEEQREVLVWAALTVIQAWVAAGQPSGSKTFGGFERWCAVMGGILQVAGVPGFLENSEDLSENSDADATAFQGFLAVWCDRFGSQPVTTADLFPLSEQLDLGNGEEHSRRIRLGRLLHRQRDRRIGDVRIEKVGLRAGAQNWRLVRKDANTASGTGSK